MVQKQKKYGMLIVTKYRTKSSILSTNKRRHVSNSITLSGSSGKPPGPVVDS